MSSLKYSTMNEWALSGLVTIYEHRFIFIFMFIDDYSFYTFALNLYETNICSPVIFRRHDAHVASLQLGWGTSGEMVLPSNVPAVT